MDIELTSILNAGDVNQERVVLKITADTDIGWYAIFGCKAASKPSSVFATDIPYAYWFPKKKVKINDLIVLYTKAGTKSEKQNTDSTTSYFFYWSKDKPLWVPGITPVLVETPHWQIGESIKDRASAQ